MAKAAPDPLAQFSHPARMKALIGGWNARDPLPDMPAGDAVILQNMIPGLTGVSVRGGTITQTTGLGARVGALMNYNGPVVSRLFASAGTKIFDVSASGVVGAPVVTGLASSAFQSVMFGTPAPANYLVACNGVDPVQEYDGTTWTVPGITGAFVGVLMSPTAMVNRLWFVEKNTLHAWYLGLGSITGAATLFDLSQQCILGGHLVAMLSWSQEGGSGPLDVSCFFTSAGEVIIYNGTDPSSITTWSLVGRFRIPPPVGRQCVVKSGADVAVLTTLGVIPLSSVLSVSTSAQGQAAVTDKVKGAFQTAIAATGGLAGWQIIEYPTGAIVLVNVAQTDGITFQQYVMSTVTGAWCNFININATCWALFGSLLYFGDNGGNVHQYTRDAASDDGLAIPYVALPAFTDFAQVSVLTAAPPNGFKMILMARPSFTAIPGTAPPVSARFDYDTSIPSLVQPPAGSGGSPWDTSPWDTSPWGAAAQAIANWQAVTGLGLVASILVAGYATDPLILNHIDVIVQDGGLF